MMNCTKTWNTKFSIFVTSKFMSSLQLEVSNAPAHDAFLNFHYS